MAEVSLLGQIGVVDAIAWRRQWQQRLREPAAAATIEAMDPRLLWGFALPLLSWLDGRYQEVTGPRPIAALTAPVGSGKSTLARQLGRLAKCLGLRLAVASIDDAYRSWPEQQQHLAGNPFGVNRVPPGSHDPELLVQALARWQPGGVLTLPRFDKSLRQGQGDRSGFSRQRADAVLLEGWLLGYEPQGGAAIEHWRRESVVQSGCLALEPTELAWLNRWDEALRAYQPLWACCGSFWVMQPEDWSLVRRWRLQAEARQRRLTGQALDADGVSRMVRATLASLPPALYQPGLVTRAMAVASLGRRRQCLRVCPGLTSEEQAWDQASLSSSLIG